MRKPGMDQQEDSVTTSLVHGTRSLPSRLTLVLTSAKVFRTTTHRSPTSAPVVSLISQLTAPTLTGLSTLTVFLLSTLVPLLLVSFFDLYFFFFFSFFLLQVFRWYTNPLLLKNQANSREKSPGLERFYRLVERCTLQGRPTCTRFRQPPLLLPQVRLHRCY